MVPPAADSIRPGFPLTAPVNDPRSYPNNSDWIRLGGRAPQLIGTNGPLARGELAWIACAASSLPLPLSPQINTGALTGATFRICARSAAIAADSP
jgi:hypothetical protein